MGRICLGALVALITFAAQLLAAQSSKPGNQAGTICVLPNPPDPPTRFSPGGEYNPATLTISIDKAPPIHWPHQQRIKIENLALDQRHLMILRSDGKRIQSLWFKFTDYKETSLCVSYDGYQGVQLGDKHTEMWCKCQ